MVAWAGVIPDLDALTALGGIELYGKWHHVLTHGLVAAVVFTVVWVSFARQRWAAASLALASFHLHLICDLLGSGRAWPIAYFYPFSSWEYFSPFGWSLASWQNVMITGLAFVAIGIIGVRRGRTFAEAFLPARAEAAIVQTLRRRFGPASKT